MALTSEDDLYSALPLAQRLQWSKASLTSIAGGYVCLFRATGIPATASAPSSTTGSTCSSATTGALAFANPTGGKISNVARSLIVPQNLGTYYLADRLIQSDGLSGTSTSAQTVNTPTLPRYTDGALVELWVEIYTATGATPQTGTVSYTDNVTGAGRTGTFALTASASAGRMFRVTLQAGDANPISVQSITLAGSTGTVGSFGITMLVTLGAFPSTVTAFVPVQQGPFVIGLPTVKDSACLFLYGLTVTTSTGQITGDLSLTQK